MQDYRKLRVFKKAHNLVFEVYKASSQLPQEEKYLLNKQLRKSVTSVVFNIVEGSGRYSKKDKAHFFQMAFASSRELSYQIYLAGELGFYSAKTRSELGSSAIELEKMLHSFVNSVRAQSKGR